jgi:hypothetical protein
MKKIRMLYGLSSFLSLVIGIVIYFLFREWSNMLLFEWIPKLKFTENLLIQLTPSLFSNVLRYNIPDMLWFVSGILFLRFLWFYKAKEQKVYILSFYITGAVFEISQLSEKVPGTFDWLDLFFMGIGAFVEGLLYKTLLRRRIA